MSSGNAVPNPCGLITNAEAAEFLGHDVLLTIDPDCDTAPLIVRQHSLNPPPIDAKVRIEVVGTGIVLT